MTLFPEELSTDRSGFYDVREVKHVDENDERFYQQYCL